MRVLMRFKIPKGAEALTVAMVAGQILGLLRTQLVARQLGTEVQGEAVTIGLITGFFSTVLVLNTAWQLVQSEHGGDPEFKSSLQGVAIVRGVPLVEGECSKFGTLLHSYVETRQPGGLVYLLFSTVDSAMKAAQSLHGR